MAGDWPNHEGWRWHGRVKAVGELECIGKLMVEAIFFIPKSFPVEWLTGKLG